MCGPGSVVGIATGYGLDCSGDRIPLRAIFSAPVQTGPVAHPASCKMGTGSFPGVKSGRGVTLTPHPLLVPWSWKIRALPLLSLWAVRPVQSLSACTREHLTLCMYVHIAYGMLCLSLQLQNISAGLHFEILFAPCTVLGGSSHLVFILFVLRTFLCLNWKF